MAAPTYLNEFETAWNATTTPKTTASITTQVGDVLVAVGVSEQAGVVLNTPTNTGTAETWTLRQSVAVTDYCWTGVWTAVAANAQSMTVSFSRPTSPTGLFGGNVLHWRGSDGVGVSAKTNVASGAPSLSTGTLTSANSALVVAVGDWSATDGTTRTWRSVEGVAASENTYFRDSSAYTVYAGRHLDTGSTTAAETVGLSAPSGQKYAIVVVEVRGTAGGAPAVPPYLVMTQRVW